MGEKVRLYLIIMLFWFAQYVYIPYQTPYLTACQVSSGFIGIVVGAYGMTQMLMRIPAGLTADRSGDHRKFLIAGQISVIAANILRFLFMLLFSPSRAFSNILRGTNVANIFRNSFA